MTDDYDRLLLHEEGMAKRGSGYPQAAGAAVFTLFHMGAEAGMPCRSSPSSEVKTSIRSRITTFPVDSGNSRILYCLSGTGKYIIVPSLPWSSRTRDFETAMAMWKKE